LSWLRCNDCDRYFNAKEELDWKDRDGRISCENCLEDEEALTMAEAEEWDRRRMRATLAMMEVTSKTKGEE